MALLAIDEGEAQPDPSLAMETAAFLPGWAGLLEDFQTDEEAPLVDLHDPRAASNFQTMRGAVLEVGRVPSVRIAHPTTGETGDTFSLAVHPLPGKFSLRGELMHAFISYRVATEGAGGNGLSGRISERIRALSMDGMQELQIPQHGRGIWPQGVKKPAPFRPEEAKVFLDKECLEVIARLLLPLSLPNSLAARVPCDHSILLRPAGRAELADGLREWGGHVDGQTLNPKI
jgi:hypothetical protein